MKRLRQPKEPGSKGFTSDSNNSVFGLVSWLDLSVNLLIEGDIERFVPVGL